MTTDRRAAIDGRLAGLRGRVHGHGDDPVDVVFADGRIAVVGDGAGRDAGGDVAELPPAWTIAPGFCDVHVHGGGGHDLTGGAPDEVAGSVRFHRGHGTTTTLASLVTAPVDALVVAMRSIVAVIESDADARIAGIHLEGPFLSEAKCGAQNPAHMCDPDPDAVDALIAAGQGHLKMITLAPERAGAIEATRRFVAAGVTVAIGHTSGSTADAAAAVAAGATVATHLGNAMPPVHQREPGPVGVCLAAPEVTCELIVDGHHLHPEFVRLAAAMKGRSGVALITDAISAAGAADGRYELGGLAVEVRDGAARLAAGGSLAGSTLTMDAAVRNAVSCGWSLDAALAAAAANPARALRLADVGAIEVGKRADAVVVDGDLALRAVIADGDLVHGSL